MSFETFKEGFDREAGLYVPRDPGNNDYRHFGTKKDKKLCLSHDELLYLYSKNPPDPCTLDTRAYFELKNSGNNVLRDEHGRLCVYRKTKHFRRNEAPPIGILEHRHRDDRLAAVNSDTIACVMGEDTFCFIALRPVGDLSLETSPNLYKSGTDQPRK